MKKYTLTRIVIKMGHCSHSPRKTCLIQAREEDKKKLTSTVMFCGNPRKTALLQSGGLKSKYKF